MRFLLWLSLAFLILVPWSAAEEAPEIRLLETIPQAFSYSRTPLPLTEAPYAISIIDREDIELSGAAEIFELLRFSPGVTIFQAGAAEASVGMRGVNGLHANNILVLLDGRPVYNDFAGDNLFSYLPVSLEDLERIEIVRGPQSVIYGANAYSGVVNLITRKPPTSSSLTLKPGIPYRHQYYLALSSERQETGVYVSGAWDEVGSFADHEDRARRMKKLYTYLRRDLGPGSLTLSAGAAQGALAYFAIPNRSHTNRDGLSSFVRLQYQRGGLETEASWQNFEEDISYQDFFRNWLNIDHFDLTIKKHLRPSPSRRLMLAGACRYSTYSSGYTPKRHTQLIYSLFGEYQARIQKRLILWTGARIRHHPVTGDKVFPRLSLIYLLNPGRSLRFSAGTAYKDPTYIELYEDLWPRSWIHEIGSRRLRSERLNSYEIAYQAWFSPQFYLGTSLFYNRYQDVLGPVVTKEGGTLLIRRENLLDLDQYGGEIEASLRTGPWTLRLNYQYVWGERITETIFGPVPRHQVKGQIRYLAPEGWWFEMRAHLQDTSHYSVRDRSSGVYLWRGLSPYFWADLVLGYQPRRDLKVSLTIHNLFHDTHKEYPSGEKIGTWFGAKIDYRF